jgi:metal-responsive CopG/Arc/MetJ family transcriptional regulator
MSVKITTTLSDDMAKKVDIVKKEAGISRGAVISMALMDYFKQRETMDMLPELMEKIEKLEALNKDQK